MAKVYIANTPLILEDAQGNQFRVELGEKVELTPEQYESVAAHVTPVATGEELDAQQDDQTPSESEAEAQEQTAPESDPEAQEQTAPEADPAAEPESKTKTQRKTKADA